MSFVGVVDAVESWLAGQSFWVQIPILLAALGPLGWAVAGLVDRIVDRLLRRHTVRDAALAVRIAPTSAPTRVPSSAEHSTQTAPDAGSMRSVGQHPPSHTEKL